MPASAALSKDEAILDVWKSFEMREQRIINAITADPAVDNIFGNGFLAVVEARNKPEYEAALTRFRIAWLGEINKFGSKYKSGDAGLKKRMSEIPHPDLPALIQAEEAKAKAGNSQNLMWFVNYDRKKWEGKLLLSIWAKSKDPHLLSFNIAGMKSMDTRQQAALLEKLGPAETWLSVGGTASEILKASRQELLEDIEKSQAGYAAKTKSAREQLVKLERQLGGSSTLVAKVPRTDEIEKPKSQGGKFDGTAEKKGTGTGSVVDGRPKDRTKDIGPGTIVASAGLSVAPNTASAQMPAKGSFSIRNVPPPGNDKEFGAAASKRGGFGSKIAAAMKIPIGTLKTWMFRARKELRAIVEREMAKNGN